MVFLLAEHPQEEQFCRNDAAAELGGMKERAVSVGDRG